MTDWWLMSHTEAGPRQPKYDAHFATALGPDGTPQGQVNYHVQVGAGGCCSATTSSATVYSRRALARRAFCAAARSKSRTVCLAAVTHSAVPLGLTPTTCCPALPRPSPQSHTDLRAPPKAQYLSTLHGRAAGPGNLEPGVVEYTQDGGVLFTTAETACPAVASLLQLEKAGGSYLAGLGPSSARSAAGGGRRQPHVVRGGKGQRGQLAPRALVMIDTASGSRFKVRNHSGEGRSGRGVVGQGSRQVVSAAGC